jgi:hypothetical protein
MNNMWFIGAQICTAVFLAISSGLLFAKARGRGGPAISACQLVFGLWALNTAISHGTSSLSGKLLLEGLWYLSGAFMPSLFLLSTLRFANSSRAVPLFWLILLAWHLLIGILALSNGSHGLLWTSPRISEFGTLSYDRTLLNIINLFILLFEVLSSLVYWLQRSIIQRGVEAVRAGLMSLAIAFPMLMYLITNFLDPLKTRPDYLPLAFSLSAILVLIAVFRFGAYRTAADAD